MISKGVQITTVAKRLGHADRSATLAIYAHAIEADELAAATAWNDEYAPVIAG